MSEDTTNGETTVEEETTDETLTPEQIAELKARAARAEQLEVENGSLKRDLKKAQKLKEPEVTQEKTQTNEPDYSRIAYLNSVQVTHADDQKAVMEEAERLKLPLTDVLNMEHMQSRLKSMQNERAVKDGVPTGSGRTGEGHKGEVEYYLAHPDETPDDLELHNKVIDARMKQQTQGNKFEPIRI